MKVMLNGINTELSLSAALDILSHSALTGGIKDSTRVHFQSMLKKWQSLEQYEKRIEAKDLLSYVPELTVTERTAFLLLVNDAISS